MVSQLPASEYAAYFEAYLSKVPEGDLLELLEISLHDFIRFVQDIPLGKHEYRYAPGKWDIRDIIQHLIDCERIFSYRALRIARGDKTPLPGFEEDDYAANSNAGKRHLQDLLTELSLVRHSTLALFKSISPDKLLLCGTASGNNVSARAIGFIIIGHMIHHREVYRERYLQ